MIIFILKISEFSIFSVPIPYYPLRTEEFSFTEISPYATTYIKQVVRRFWLFINFLRTYTSLALTTYGGISLFPDLSVLHHLLKASCTEILAFLSFPPYQHLPDTHHVRRNIGFPGFLRTPPPTQNKLYGDFGFSSISSVPAPHWHSQRTEEFGLSPFSSVPTHPRHSLRTEEYHFFRISPYPTTYIKQVVRRFWLFINFLRTSTSLALTTYGGISLFPNLSVLPSFQQYKTRLN